jgi:hypothetical protein
MSRAAGTSAGIAAATLAVTAAVRGDPPRGAYALRRADFAVGPAAVGTR